MSKSVSKEVWKTVFQHCTAEICRSITHFRCMTMHCRNKNVEDRERNNWVLDFASSTKWNPLIISCRLSPCHTDLVHRPVWRRRRTEEERKKNGRRAEEQCRQAGRQTGRESGRESGRQGVSQGQHWSSSSSCDQLLQACSCWNFNLPAQAPHCHSPSGRHADMEGWLLCHRARR